MLTASQGLRRLISVVICRCFVQLLEKREFVFDPEARAGLRNQRLDTIHRLQRKFPINIECRYAHVLAANRKVVEIAGKQGRVEEISLLTTKLRTRDNLEIILPNRTIVNNIITNFHANPERRIELEIAIAYEEDLQQAISVIQKAIAAEERVLAEPEPIVAVADLNLNGVKLDIRPWVKQEDFSATRYELRQNIKLALDSQNIALPYQPVQLHGTDQI